MKQSAAFFPLLCGIALCLLVLSASCSAAPDHNLEHDLERLEHDLVSLHDTESFLGTEAHTTAPGGAKCKFPWDNGVVAGIKAAPTLLNSYRDLTGSLDLSAQIQTLAGLPPLPPGVPAWWLGLSGSMSYTDKLNMYGEGSRVTAYTRTLGGFIQFRSWITFKIPITARAWIEGTCPSSGACFGESAFKRIWRYDTTFTSHIILKSAGKVEAFLDKQITLMKKIKQGLTFSTDHIGAIENWRNKFVEKIRKPWEHAKARLGAIPTDGDLKNTYKLLWNILNGESKYERFGLAEILNKLCGIGMQSFANAVVAIWNPYGSLDGVPIKWRKSEMCMFTVAPYVSVSIDDLYDFLERNSNSRPLPLSLLERRITAVETSISDLVTLIRDIQENGGMLNKVHQSLKNQIEKLKESARRNIAKTGVSIKYSLSLSVGAEGGRTDITGASTFYFNAGTGYEGTASSTEPEGTFGRSALTLSAGLRGTALDKYTDISVTGSRATDGKWSLMLSLRVTLALPKFPTLWDKIKNPVIILASLLKDPTILGAFENTLTTVKQRLQDPNTHITDAKTWSGLGDNIATLTGRITTLGLQAFVDTQQFREATATALNKGISLTDPSKQNLLTWFSKTLLLGLDLSFSLNGGFTFDPASSLASLSYVSDINNPRGQLNLPAVGADFNFRLASSIGVELPIDRICAAP